MEDAKTLERQEIIGEKRGPGRPRKTRTTIEREEIDPDDEESAVSDVALFAANEIAGCERIDIFRQGPIDEGLLGKLSAEDTEDTIKNTYGGGTYVLFAKDSRGKILSRRALKVAGDPIFTSAIARTQWKRMNPDLHQTSSNDDGKRMDIIEVMQMMDAREEKTRKDIADREEQRRARETEDYNRRRAEEREHEERKRREEREWEEKRRRDEEERERRRRQDEEERDKRARVAQEEAEARRRREDAEIETRRSERERQAATQNQEFFKSMLAMHQQSAVKSDPMEQFGKMVTAFAAVKDTFGAEGGGMDDGDPWTMLIKNLPGILKTGIPAIGTAVSEIRGVGQSPTMSPSRQLVDASGQPYVLTQTAASNGVELPPELQQKFMVLAGKWMEEGKDPVTMFNRTADILLGNVGKGPASSTPTPTQEVTPATPVTTGPRRLKYRFQRRVG